jgi:hypothetical protein
MTKHRIIEIELKIDLDLALENRKNARKMLFVSVIYSLIIFAFFCICLNLLFSIDYSDYLVIILAWLAAIVTGLMTCEGISDIFKFKKDLKYFNKIIASYENEK